MRTKQTVSYEYDDVYYNIEVTATYHWEAGETGQQPYLQFDSFSYITPEEIFDKKDFELRFEEWAIDNIEVELV